MTIPDITEAVGQRLWEFYNGSGCPIFHERYEADVAAQAAIDAVRKADAEAGAVTLMPGEQPPWNARTFAWIYDDVVRLSDYSTNEPVAEGAHIYRNTHTTGDAS